VLTETVSYTQDTQIGDGKEKYGTATADKASEEDIGYGVAIARVL
jgi:hypothetical protein